MPHLALVRKPWRWPDAGALSGHDEPPDLVFAPSDRFGPFTDQLRLAVAAYLARFKGPSREHTQSDLRCFLTWCAENGLDPLGAPRPQLELYIRWMQEVRRFKPSTVSRPFSVAAGFYRTCVIDALLEHSPAKHVRRPTVPPESPTLGRRRTRRGLATTASTAQRRLADEAQLETLRRRVDQLELRLAALERRQPSDPLT